jgi:predicted transcriptional regulator
MGHAQKSHGGGVQIPRMRKRRTQNELEELREENKQLRELVAQLIQSRIAEAVEPEEHSASS